MSTLEADFIPLSIALEGRKVKRVWARGIGLDSKGGYLKGNQRAAFVKKMLHMNGEWYAGRWTASSDTERAMGYATILVIFEDE